MAARTVGSVRIPLVRERQQDAGAGMLLAAARRKAHRAVRLLLKLDSYKLCESQRSVATRGRAAQKLIDAAYVPSSKRTRGRRAGRHNVHEPSCWSQHSEASRPRAWTTHEQRGDSGFTREMAIFEHQ